MNVKKDKFEHWSAEDSATLYGINDWGAGYFHVNEKGELTISPNPDKDAPAVSLPDIVQGIRERGMNMPVLIRVSNILESRINQLHASFRKAVQESSVTATVKKPSGESFRIQLNLNVSDEDRAILTAGGRLNVK